MKSKKSKLGWVALSAWVVMPALGSVELASAQGPVRNGARAAVRGTARVAEGAARAAVQGTAAAARGTAQAARRAGQATRNVIGGAAQGAANAVRHTGDAARNLGRNTRDAIQGDFNNQRYNANQQQYQSGYRGDLQSSGQYVDQVQHQQGYQGSSSTQQGNWSSSQGYAQSGRAYTLRYDNWGREFICVNGQRVYFDQQTSPGEQQPTAADQNRDQYGNDSSGNVQATYDAPVAAGENSASENVNTQNNLQPQERTANRVNLDTDVETDADAQGAATVEGQQTQASASGNIGADVDSGSSTERDDRSQSEALREATQGSNAVETPNAVHDAD